MKLTSDKEFEYVLYHKDRDGGEIIVRLDCTCYGDLISRFMQFSLACGFNPDTVNSYFEGE